jgi:hypothetical protein
MNLAELLCLLPCARHADPACARCYDRSPTPADVVQATELHARAERLGLVPARQATLTAVVWRVRPPRLITLRALVLKLAGALLAGLLGDPVRASPRNDLGELRALAERLRDVGAGFDRRLAEGSVR